MLRGCLYAESNVHLCQFWPLLILGAILYQEQGGKDWVIGYTSWALSKSESHHPTHKLEFLEWAIMESFQEYLYGNTFTLYSDNNPLTYVLTTAKLDAAGQRWIAKLTKFKFTIYYQSGKSNVDVLSQIPWGQNIKPEAVEAILKALMP